MISPSFWTLRTPRAQHNGVRALPSTFVIGRDGRIVWEHAGALDWSDSKLRDALKGLLEKHAPHPPRAPVEARLCSKAGS
jgi:hypothetical protein